MKEITGNLWDYYGRVDHVVCITTNGTIKKNGSAVMGRGCAAQAKHRIGGIDRRLGRHIAQRGNTPVEISPGLIVFPVKNQWHEPASLLLITQSAVWLRELANRFPYANYILPRPGCGNGQRDWETEVKPLLLEVVLPDNVCVITKKEEAQ